MTNYILIDGSYFVFYRFYALLNWWKLAKKDTPLDIPIENEEFVAKFRKTCISKITMLSDILSISNPIIIVAKDCKREKEREKQNVKRVKVKRNRVRKENHVRDVDKTLSKL